MHSAAADQADGLRRMFSTDRMRVLALLAGCDGVGRSTLAANLGAALARNGRGVFLVDANAAPPDALGALGLASRTDAAGALAAGAPFESAIVHGGDGLEALRLGKLPRDARSLAVTEGLLRHASSFDFLLLNCPDPAALGALAVASERLDVIVVLSRAASSITEAYALIKRMVTDWSHRRFQILVNRVDSEAEAAAIFGNMARVAGGYLNVALELIGFVPADERIARAARAGRCVLDAFPDAAGAIALRRLAEAIGGSPVPRAQRIAHERRAAEPSRAP